MTEFNFTFNNQAFVLDTGKGVLLGKDSEVKDVIVNAVSASTGKQLGAGYSPIPPTQIVDPYHNIEQFALCLLFNTNELPDELKSYIPTWEEDELVDEKSPLNDEENLLYSVDELLILN